MGANVARKLTTRAMQCGHMPKQDNMATPLLVQGVGHGSMECKWQVTSPIAMTDETGSTRLHRITAPVVTGAGEHMPGLLGLRSLEHERAILDCGSRKLHLLGRGEAQLNLPPGSVSNPCTKRQAGT